MATVGLQLHTAVTWATGAVWLRVQACADYAYRCAMAIATGVLWQPLRA